MKAQDLLVRSFIERHPDEAARAIERVDPPEAAKLLSRLPTTTVAPVLERLSPAMAAAVLTSLGPEDARALLRTIPLQHAGFIVRLLEETVREAALTGMPENLATALRTALQFPSGTAGAVMDPEVTSVPVDLTISESIALLRRAPRSTLYYVYVTDRERRLVGVLTMRDLVLGAPREPIEPLLQRNVVTVKATTELPDVAAIMRERGFVAIPAIDESGRLIGVVKHDQVIEVAQEEAFEDLQQMVGAGRDERAMSPVSTVVQRRLPWLMVNLLTAFAAAAVVGLFEGVIARVTALAVLMPIVAGQGGNTGQQSLAVVMRGIALGEVGGRRGRILVKELLAGLLNGLAVAVVVGFVVLLWDGRWELATVMATAMLVNMAVAALAGAAIPQVLKAMGRDPAQASTIFLTLVTDVVGFAAFLGFAYLML